MPKKKKLLYNYNSETGLFSLMEKKKFHLPAFIIYLLALAVAVAIVWVPIRLSDESEKIEQMRKKNEELLADFNQLSRRTEELTAVMRDIADRDNNFYRAILQAEPLSESQRYGSILSQGFRPDALDSLPDAALISSVSANIDMLEAMIYSQSKSFDYLRNLSLTQKDRLDYMPAIQPIADKDLEHLSSGFGIRTDPVYGVLRRHEGMDFSAPIGAPVYATANGTVSFAGWKNGYGNCIDVDHGYDYFTRYAHLSKIEVKVGQKVTRGEQIGLVGNTGKSTGPHLHYEVRYKNVAQNPVNYYFYDLTPEQYDQMILHAQNAGRMMD